MYNYVSYNSIKSKRGVKIIDVQDSYSFKVNHLKRISKFIWLNIWYKYIIEQL